jgi:NAD(P)-dependent dehydrogenase (short-subunit alcohol dehydrogenase family)
MTSLSNATVLITGANGGLGTTLVQAALDRGADRVYAAARHPQQWDAERVVPLQLDVADAASIEQAAAQAADTTILVNNAALFARTDLLNGPIDDLTSTLETNLVGPIRLTRALAPALRSANGALVNINSILPRAQHRPPRPAWRGGRGLSAVTSGHRRRRGAQTAPSSAQPVRPGDRQSGTRRSANSDHGLSRSLRRPANPDQVRQRQIFLGEVLPDHVRGRSVTL